LVSTRAHFSSLRCILLGFSRQEKKPKKPEKVEKNKKIKKSKK